MRISRHDLKHVSRDVVLWPETLSLAPENLLCTRYALLPTKFLVSCEASQYGCYYPFEGGEGVDYLAMSPGLHTDGITDSVA